MPTRSRAVLRFARLVATTRQAAGLTQKELAARARVDHNQVSRLERGQSDPTLSLVLALLSALDLHPDVLTSRNCGGKPQ